ncbi:EamA family transporter [Salaquimonas pukyongi]|uniref:EamA family transporter n=1 Tax=Salaquimonas pukyongi TaxID=2712698 RepID=UPI00096BC0E2|nr:EamA family transporter [Salaquimonas pukyongi]
MEPLAVSGTPSSFAIALILCAALLHALWNAMVKGAVDQPMTLGLVNLGHFLLGIVMVSLFSIPAAESWPFLVASTVIHFFYYGFLLLAYRHGDLSQVYPLARGVAPVLVALGGWGIAGEALPLSGWIGIALVSSGIAILLIGRRISFHGTALFAAFMTGLIIAAYTVVDGLGVRTSQNAFGYIGWLLVLESISAVFLLTWRRQALMQTGPRLIAVGIFGGLLSAIAYGLAIYAMSLTQLANVSAIRESSVIMAALIGVIWLGERPWKKRVIAALVVAAGIIVLASGG